jgi:hypothetical protein
MTGVFYTTGGGISAEDGHDRPRTAGQLCFVEIEGTLTPPRSMKECLRRPLRSFPVVSRQPVETGVRPPPQLRPLGLALWRDVVETYEFSDPGSYTILGLACQALDRADAIRKQIDKHGEMLTTETGVRANPLLRDEYQNRGLCARLLGQLGLDLEPVKGVGRPPGPTFA